MRHVGELAPVLASEIGPAETGLLLLPPALTFGPLAVRCLPAVRRWMHGAPPAPPRRAWHAVLVALPLLLLLLLPPATALPPTHRTLSYAGMLDSMRDDRPFEPDDLAGLADADAPPFATRDLRLVPTDRTHRLNVVVVILESIRSRSATPYNPLLATTPFLDDLARRSLLVEKMYGIISYTNKALVPILGGVYPELGREIVEARPGGVPAAGLPTLLQPHGYRTAFFTPATMAFEDKDEILRNLGFDDIYGDAAYDKTGFHQVNYFGYEERVMLEPSMAWVDDVTARNQPFFLSYLTLTPHHPYETPPTFEKQPFDTLDARYNDYLNALHYNDVFLKDLFDAFEQRGLIDSTLFVILGDHGEAFDEHGQSMHGDLIWDEAIQVPALLYNPTLFPEGGLVSGNRSQIDVMPTIADALGYRLEGGLVPGLSLLDPVPAGRPVYHSARNGNQLLALRQDSLKFFYYNRRRPMQVFDTRNDPLERRDIAHQIDPNLLKSVELKLLLWRRGVQQQYHLSAAASDRHAAWPPAPDRQVAAIRP
jgi:arylsulfatase A-like enzyme